MFFPEQSTHGTAGLMLHTLVLCRNSLEKGISCPTDEPGLRHPAPPAKFILLHKKFSPSCGSIHMLPGAWCKHTTSISMLLAPFGPFLFPQQIHAFRAGGKQVNQSSMDQLSHTGNSTPRAQAQISLNAVGGKNVYLETTNPSRGSHVKLFPISCLPNPSPRGVTPLPRA